MSTGEVAALREALRAATAAIWTEAPADLERLLAVSLPPGGRMPCVLYANFDLFWLGEICQVLLASAPALTPADRATVAGAMLERFASRASHWQLEETIGMAWQVAAALGEPTLPLEEYRALLEDFLIFANRVQAWVDRLIPWIRLDAAVELLPLPSREGR